MLHRPEIMQWPLSHRDGLQNALQADVGGEEASLELVKDEMRYRVAEVSRRVLFAFL